MQTSNFMSILSINREKGNIISEDQYSKSIHYLYQRLKTGQTATYWIHSSEADIDSSRHEYSLDDVSKISHKIFFSHERNNMDHSSRSSSDIRQTHYFITIRDLHSLKAVSSSTYHRWTIKKTSFKATNCRSSSKVKYEANRCNPYRSGSRDKFGKATPTKKSRFKS